MAFAPWNGAHVEGMTEDEGAAFPGAQIGEPVPAVDALDGDDQELTRPAQATEPRS